MPRSKKCAKHNKHTNILCRLLNYGKSCRGKQANCPCSASKVGMKTKPKCLQKIKESWIHLECKPLHCPNTKRKHTECKNKDDLSMARCCVSLNCDDSCGSIDSIQRLHRRTCNKRNGPKKNQMVNSLFNSGPADKFNNAKKNHESDQCYCRFCLQLSAVRPVHCRHYDSSHLEKRAKAYKVNNEQSLKCESTNSNIQPYPRNNIGNSPMNNCPNFKPNSHPQNIQNHHTNENNCNCNNSNPQYQKNNNAQCDKYRGNINDSSNSANENFDWLCKCHCCKKPNENNKNYYQNWKSDFNGCTNKNQPDGNLMTNNQDCSHSSWDSKNYNANYSTCDPGMNCKFCGNQQNENRRAEQYPRRNTLELKADNGCTFSVSQTRYNGNTCSSFSFQHQNEGGKNEAINKFELYCKCFTDKQNKEHSEENNSKNCKMCGLTKHTNVINTFEDDKEGENSCKFCSIQQNGSNQQKQNETQSRNCNMDGSSEQNNELKKFEHNRKGDNSCKCSIPRQENVKANPRESRSNCNVCSKGAQGGNHKPEQCSKRAQCQSETGPDEAQPPAKHVNDSNGKCPPRSREEKRKKFTRRRRSEKKERLKDKGSEKVKSPRQDSDTESDDGLTEEMKSSSRDNRGRAEKCEKSNRDERTRDKQKSLNDGMDEKDEISIENIDSDVSMTSVLNILREKCRGTNNLKLKVVKLPKDQTMSEKGKPRLKVTVR